MSIDWAVVFMFIIAVPFWAWAFWLVTNDEARKRFKDPTHDTK